jgi:hypothetical protein
MTSADHICDVCIFAHMIASFSLSIVQCQVSVSQALNIYIDIVKSSCWLDVVKLQLASMMNQLVAH